MPIYTYKCSETGETFDLIRRMSEMDDPAKCSRSDCSCKPVREMTVNARPKVVGGTPMHHRKG